MGSGCLSPPNPIFQLNLTLVDEIFEDIKQWNLGRSQSESQNLNNYLEIKERIGKKSQLKQLCDHLSSHRSKIYQTVLHAYRITHQSKFSIYKYVCIIVLDAVLNSASSPKMVNSFKSQGKTMAVKPSHSPKNNSLLILNNEEREMTVSSKTNGKQLIENIQTEQSITTPGYQVTSHKFQGVYFTTILLLLRSDDILYELCLENLIKYCQFSHSPFNTETQTIQLLNNISYHIQTNSYLEVSLKCYFVILFRMRENYFTQNLQNLQIFFELWLSEGQKISGQKELSRLKISQLCMSIINIYFRNCIEGYHYTIILQVIFMALDKCKFDHQTANKIQNLITESTNGLELKQQFHKSFIIYLIGYVGFPATNESFNVLKICSKDSPLEQDQGQQKYKYKNPLQKKWSQCFNLGNPHRFVKMYKNINERKTKLNGLSRISKWVFQSQFINQFLTYSGVKLFFAYVLNFYSEQPIIKDKSIMEFKGFFDKLTSKSQRAQLLNIVFSQLEESEILDEQARYSLLLICQAVLDKEKQIFIPNNQSYFLQYLDSSLSFQSNKKILEVGISVLTKINKQNAKAHLQRICQFYAFFYFQIIHGFTNISQKLFLIQRLCTFNSKLPEFYEGIQFAFVEKLLMDRNELLVPENSLFFIDTIIMYLSSRLNINISNSNLQFYVKKVKEKKDFEQLSIIEKYASERIFLSISYSEKDKLSRQFYSQSVQLFKKNQRKQHEVTGSASVFWKPGNSLIKTESKDSVYTKGDLDLQNILDIIRN